MRRGSCAYFGGGPKLECYGTAVSYLARSCMIERKLPLLSIESSSLDSRKGKSHFVDNNVTFTSLSKTFRPKFVFSRKDASNVFLLSPVSPLLINDTRLRMMHGVLFHGFEFAGINASSHLNLLYTKGFEVCKKSLERHFNERINSRANSKQGRCLMNNFVVLDLIM